MFVSSLCEQAEAQPNNDRVRAFGIDVPQKYKVHGIDVSKWQKELDWKSISTMKDGKDSISITFAFIKATEGRSFKDIYFAYNWVETKKHNITRGAYHFYKPDVKSTLQAKNFISVVKLSKGDLPPVLDIEEVGKFGPDNMKKGVKNWLKTIEKHYGVKPIIYTNINFYKRYLSGKDFEGYKFWLAHYTKNELKADGDWVFWQYSDKGTISKVGSKIAFNVMKGTGSDLKKLCKK